MRVLFLSSAIIAVALAAISPKKNNDFRKKSNEQESESQVAQSISEEITDTQTIGVMTRSKTRAGAAKSKSGKKQKVEEMSVEDNKVKEAKPLTAEDISNIVSKHMEAFMEKLKEGKEVKKEAKSEVKKEETQVKQEKSEDTASRRPKSRRNRKMSEKGEEKKPATNSDKALVPIADEKKEERKEESNAVEFPASDPNRPTKSTSDTPTTPATSTSATSTEASKKGTNKAVAAAAPNNDKSISTIAMAQLNLTATHPAVPSPFDVRRKNLMERIYNFIRQQSGHPLNTFLSKVAALLGQLDEQKIDLIWSELGPFRQQAVIQDFSNFTESMVSLSKSISCKYDDKVPTLHYAPGSREALEIKKDHSFAQIVKVFRNIDKRYNPTKRDFLAFIEAQMELFERDALFDAVEVDIFNPLFVLIESWEKTFCGYPSAAKRGKPLPEIYQIFVDDVKLALADVLDVITYKNHNKDGYLQINRHSGQGRLLSKLTAKNNFNALIEQKSLQLGKIILATSLVAYLLMTLLILFQYGFKNC